MHFELQTERLRIIALSKAHLQIWQEKGKESLDKQMELTFIPIEMEAEFMQEFEKMLPVLIDGISRNSSDWLFRTHYEIILKNGHCSIGGIGLMRMEDPGAVQVGIFIDKRVRGRGLATEALTELTNWALQQPAVDSLYAETKPGAMDSFRVLEKAGFTSKRKDENLRYWRKFA